MSHLWEPTFGVGARVKVIKQRKYPSEKLIGLVGTVRSGSGAQVTVILDDKYNHRSSYGCYYFKPVELELVNESKEDNNMSKITNYLNIANVRPVYTHASTVYSCANFECGLGVDDLCVVTTDNNSLAVARVVEIVYGNDREMHREVVTKISTDAYDERVRNRVKAAELKSKMEARAKQLQDIALYKMLAKDDPDMALLLQEYQNIPG